MLNVLVQTFQIQQLIQFIIWKTSSHASWIVLKLFISNNSWTFEVEGKHASRLSWEKCADGRKTRRVKPALPLPLFIPQAEIRFSTNFVCYNQFLLSRFFHEKPKTKTLWLVNRIRPESLIGEMYRWWQKDMKSKTSSSLIHSTWPCWNHVYSSSHLSFLIFCRFLRKKCADGRKW